MRNPKRINRMMRKLRMLWEEIPDIRLGQLLHNMTHKVYDDREAEADVFNVEDRDIEKEIDIALLRKGIFDSQDHIDRYFGKKGKQFVDDGNNDYNLFNPKRFVAKSDEEADEND